MSSPQIIVPHWLLTRTIRTYGPRGAESDLLGVALDSVVPADVEYPLERRSVVLYLRSLARDAGITEFLVRVHHERRPDEWELTTVFTDIGRPFVLPADGTVDIEDALRVPFITLVGDGLYAVTIYFRPLDPDIEFPEPDPMPWDPDEPGWTFGAADYFRVSRT